MPKIILSGEVVKTYTETEVEKIRIDAAAKVAAAKEKFKKNETRLNRRISRLEKKLEDQTRELEAKLFAAREEILEKDAALLEYETDSAIIEKIIEDGIKESEDPGEDPGDPEGSLGENPE